MKRWKWVLLGATLSACASPVAPHASATEHYTLTSIGGVRLPAGVASGVVYWGGSVELRADSTFVDVIRWGNAQRVEVLDSVRGTYRVVGDSLRMTPDGWTPYALARDSARATLRARWEAVYVYKRD